MGSLCSIRVAAASIAADIADVHARASCICNRVDEAASENVALIVFPELSLSSASCADLFSFPLMEEAVTQAIGEITAHSKGLGITIAVGAPVPFKGSLYDCAVIIRDGKISGIVPKTVIPAWQRRWFTGAGCLVRRAGNFATVFNLAGFQTVLSPDITLSIGGTEVGFELGEDAFSPCPRHEKLSAGGARIIAHLSALPAMADKHFHPVSKMLTDAHRLKLGFIHSNAGLDESTGDFVFDGRLSIISPDGSFLSGQEFGKASLLVSDMVIDGDIPAFDEPIGIEASSIISQETVQEGILSDPAPFSLDADGLERALDIQAAGLAGRMKRIGCNKAVVGISGGLDSTLAVLCAIKAFDMSGLPHENIIGITMPGFGTSERTHDNAGALMKELGISHREIPIGEACRIHLADIGHDGKTADVCYENAQARERTQILMDVANAVGAIVIGTGDLSEIALGWCTYNGDHMSNYAVNASIPKTLVRDMVRHRASTQYAGTPIESILTDIVATPVSPELTGGNEQQKTEDIIGPYELHDYFIYNLLHRKLSPKTVLEAAKACFRDKYSEETVGSCMNIFIRRFFTQQFKRSCSPDGPQVTAVSLSPRYGWQMPSDCSSGILKNL